MLRLRNAPRAVEVHLLNRSPRQPAWANPGFLPRRRRSVMRSLRQRETDPHLPFVDENLKWAERALEKDKCSG